MFRFATHRRPLARTVAVVALAVTAVAATASSAAAAPSGEILNEGGPGAVKDSYIVMFRPEAAEARRPATAAGELSRRYGGAVRRAFTSNVRGFSVKLPAAAARRLAAHPSVAFVEQDRRVRITGTQNNPPWGLDRLDQAGLPLSASYTYPSSSGVTAYILDTGIRISHKDFGGRARYGYDFIDGDTVASDCNGHGTHVAGTVGGAKYGVAKQVRLVAVRVLDCNGYGQYSKIIAGVDWVTKQSARPAVANMSLGGPASAALDAAVKRSIAAGVTYAVSAGNDNVDACTQSPARVPAALTVGATDRYDARASFSNYGRCLDIFAPGVQIVSASHSSDTGSATKSGTSMAAPHVAGVAALLLSANPKATPEQVRAAMLAGATNGKVSRVGSGSPNVLLRAVAGPMDAAVEPRPAATTVSAIKPSPAPRRLSTAVKPPSASERCQPAAAIKPSRASAPVSTWVACR